MLSCSDIKADDIVVLCKNPVSSFVVAKPIIFRADVKNTKYMFDDIKNRKSNKVNICDDILVNALKVFDEYADLNKHLILSKSDVGDINAITKCCKITREYNNKMYAKISLNKKKYDNNMIDLVYTNGQVLHNIKLSEIKKYLRYSDNLIFVLAFCGFWYSKFLKSYGAYVELKQITVDTTNRIYTTFDCLNDIDNNINIIAQYNLTNSSDTKIFDEITI